MISDTTFNFDWSGKVPSKTVADLKPPSGPKFSQFHAVFSEILIKSYVGVPPAEGWRPLLQGILDPPLLGWLFLETKTFFKDDISVIYLTTFILFIYH